jgi:hypothetical protein
MKFERNDRSFSGQHLAVRFWPHIISMVQYLKGSFFFLPIRVSPTPNLLVNGNAVSAVSGHIIYHWTSVAVVVSPALQQTIINDLTTSSHSQCIRLHCNHRTASFIWIGSLQWRVSCSKSSSFPLWPPLSPTGIFSGESTVLASWFADEDDF